MVTLLVLHILTVWLEPPATDDALSGSRQPSSMIAAVAGPAEPPG